MTNDVEQEGATLKRSALFFVKPYGVDWFDEIVNNDEIIQKASCPPDLLALDKRLDELEAIHNVKRPS